MGLFYNYDRAGKGVAKSGPRKKPFFRFWELFARKFWKFFQINIVYLLFCVPIVTFGPATAAMTHVMRKFVLEQPIFVFSEFWSAFKKNFKQSVGVGIVDVGLIVLFVFAINFYDKLLSTATTPENFILTALTAAAGLFLVIMHFYIYLQIVALKLTIGPIIRNSIRLTVLGLKSNIVAMAVCAGVVTIFVLLFPYSVMVLPVIPFAWLSFVIAFCCYPVIQRTIINPYYESRGEKNPEIPDYDEVEAIFEDKGGKEPEIKGKAPKFKGKVIH